jgi:hypothetical protein
MNEKVELLKGEFEKLGFNLMEIEKGGYIVAKKGISPNDFDIRDYVNIGGYGDSIENIESILEDMRKRNDL